MESGAVLIAFNDVLLKFILTDIGHFISTTIGSKIQTLGFYFVSLEFKVFRSIPMILAAWVLLFLTLVKR